MAHKAQLYLYEGIRETNIKSLNSMREIYFDRIAPGFSNIKEETEKYQQDYWKEYLSSLNPEEASNIQEDDFAEAIYEIGSERYQMLSLMRYRTLALWISMLSQVWEQQNIVFLWDELSFEGLKISTKKGKQIKNLGITEIIALYKSFGVNLSNLPMWGRIEEMRHLVNVLKHAEGNSAAKLRKIRPDFFDSHGWGDALELFRTSLNEEVLKIEDQDFIDYHEALIQFWEILPERMYCVSKIQYPKKHETSI